MIRNMIIGLTVILLTAGSLSACGKKRPPVAPSQTEQAQDTTN
ncbi:hypothetical protein [Curvivirga aplysinae]|nr:hypothetical protein [Curvivirga aplysinae]